MTAYGNSCPQQAVTLPAPVIDGTLPVEVIDLVVNTLFDVIEPQSEDCLTINVIKPATATASSKLPVAVVSLNDYCNTNLPIDIAVDFWRRLWTWWYINVSANYDIHSIQHLNAVTALGMMEVQSLQDPSHSESLSFMLAWIIGTLASIFLNMKLFTFAFFSVSGALNLRSTDFKFINIWYQPSDSWPVKKSKPREWVILACRIVSFLTLWSVISFWSVASEREALRWIQKYIGAFGGDPTKVTMCVFPLLLSVNPRLNPSHSWGESAGAISVALQMLTNGGNTEGLFRGGFMQSGSPIPVRNTLFISQRPSRIICFMDSGWGYHGWSTILWCHCVSNRLQ